MPRTFAPPVQLDPPHRIIYAGRTATIGPTVYLALSAIQAAGGCIPVAELCRAVWGDLRRPPCVWSLCTRLNRAFADVGYPFRAGTDGPDLTIV